MTRTPLVDKGVGKSKRYSDRLNVIPSLCTHRDTVSLTSQTVESIFMLLSNLPLALLLFQASCLLIQVSGKTNFSIGYQDPLFKYTGNWTVILGSLDRAGGHMMTQSQNAYATITYTCAYSSIYIDPKSSINSPLLFFFLTL